METGSGVLGYAGYEGAVDYAVSGSAADLRPGGPSLRATITTSSEIAREAFRTGDVRLQAADGRRYRMKVLAHSEGSGTAYGDLRI